MLRRDFLKKTGLLTTGTLFTAKQDFQNDIQPLEKNGSVLILGAGFAGLSAAYYLQKKGVKYKILEARNRAGGRVFTSIVDKETGLHTELGAEWVGASHQLLINLCDEMGLKRISHTFKGAVSLQNKYQNWQNVIKDEAWEQKFKDLMKNFERLPQKEQHKLDKLDWWRYLVENGIPEQELELRELNDSTDFGETIRNVSAFAAISEYAYSSNNNEMDYKIEGGNSELTKALTEKVGKENVLLGKKAISVNQTGKEVEVICEDGEKYTASRLICTLPAFAVSKINWKPFFPPEKLEAIKQLQYARIMKTPVLFAERFWQEEDFSMTTDRLAHFIFHTSQNQPVSKGLLTSYTIGDKAHIFSRLNPEQKIREVCQALQPAFGDMERLAEKVTGYYWGDDVFSQGAYANYDVGQWFGIREIIAKPFLKTVFAGEHIAEWQGFMEGALKTGKDAAEALVG
jgi:monoamine oxidase